MCDAHSNPADPRTDRASLTIRDPPAGPIVDTAAPSTEGNGPASAPAAGRRRTVAR